MARGWVNGLDLAGMAARYLPALGNHCRNVDLRIVKSTLINVLQELSLAAKRQNVVGADILFRQANRIRSLHKGPSLSDFIESLEHGGDFNENELIEIYKERFGTDRTDERKARLIKRQLDLLNLLSSKVSQPMSLTDSVTDWFIDPLAKRLEQSNLHSIEQLCLSILNAPEHWYTSAPGVAGVGEGKAYKISSMLEAHLGDMAVIAQRIGFIKKTDDRPALSLQLAPHFSTPNQQIVFIPETVSVTPGQSTGSLLKATTDLEAMQTWLSLKASPLTINLYRREIKRVIYWAHTATRKTLSGLSVEDAIHYREFLLNTPTSMIVKKGPQRGFKKLVQDDPDRVCVAGFAKTGLSPSSVKKALVIVSGFFSWLVDVRHVQANPFSSVKMSSSLPGTGERSTRSSDLQGLERDRTQRASITDRTLPTEAIIAVRSHLDTDDHNPEEVRIRTSFVFELAIHTGMRISELAAARFDHLHFLESHGEPGGWMISVIGKRAKAREVPFPPALVTKLVAYLQHRQVLDAGQSLSNVSAGTFLIGALPSVRPLADRADGVRPQTIHLCLKQLFESVVKNHEFANPTASKQLSMATTHWLRHTAATRAVAAEVPLDVVASTLGHASLTTTSRYVTADRFRKMTEMTRLWDAIPRPS